MSNPLESASSELALNGSVWFFAGQVDESEHVRHVPIRTTPFRIGRRPDLPLSLPCNCVSKEHAEVFEVDGSLWLRDLGSTNGTYVNGVRLSSEVRLKEGDIVQFATVVFRVSKQTDEDPTDGGTIQEDACDRALAMVQFDRLINDRAVVPFYQSIVDITSPDIETIGYEVLGRSKLFGLRTPKEMFATAARLNLEAELSRIFRLQGIEAAATLDNSLALFVNTHPIELSDEQLLPSIHRLRDIEPDRLIVLEIHEAAITNPEMIRELRDNLTDLDVKLAFDDFGAGQARLLELAEVRPEYIKFDMKLIQGIHLAPAHRQQVVALLTRMVSELGIISLAEGVESEADHATLKQMGFQLGQGFLYGRPQPLETITASPHVD